MRTATTLLLLLVFLHVKAADFEIDGISYNINDDKTTVSVTQPSDSFHHNNIQELLSIPEKVFYNNVTFTVTGIEKHAFRGCNIITTVSIPKTITNIGVGAFSLCTNLKGFYVNNGNTHYKSIGGVLFTADETELLAYPAQKQGNYTIPAATKNIKQYAFSACQDLKVITIPQCVSNIEILGFEKCHDLQDIIVDVLNEKYYDINGVLFSKTLNELILFPNKNTTSYEIPEQVTKINPFAFFGSPNLKTVSIPKNTIEIGDYAFAECTNIERVYCKSKIPINISSNIFDKLNLNNIELVVPHNTKSKYLQSQVWSAFGKISEYKIKKGDINQDDVVNVSDVSMLINYILGNDDIEDITVADINEDFDINVSDVSLLINLILGSGIIQGENTKNIVAYDFENFELDSILGKYYIWHNEKLDGAFGNDWATGNPGFRLSMPSTSADKYPTAPIDGFDGKALKLTTCDTGPFGVMAKKRLAAGNFFLGEFDVSQALSDAMAATRFGIPFNLEPVKLSGYYQYQPGPKFQDKDGKEVAGRVDEGSIYAVLYRNHDAQGNAVRLQGDNVLTSPLIVAVAKVKSLPPTNEWTPFEVAFDYKSEINKTLLANMGYNIAVVFSSSVDGATFEGAIGSTLLVDKVRLTCQTEE